MISSTQTKKRALAKRLLEQGKSNDQIQKELKKKYKTGIGNGILAGMRQEEETDVLILPPMAYTETPGHGTTDPDTKVRLAGVLNWMSTEGIRRIHLDADQRLVELERTEVIHCN